MRRFVLAAVALGAVGAVTAVAAIGTGDRAAQAARGPILTPLQQHLASGTLLRALDERSAGAAPALRAQQQAGGPTANTGCPVNRGANVRVNQNCLNLSRPRPAGPRAGAERDRHRAGPERPARISSPPRTTTAAATATATRTTRRRRAHLGGLDDRRWASPAATRSAASRASTGRPAATPRSPGTPRATPTCRARCSTAGPADPATRTSRARSTCSARPAPTARRGTSPAGPWPSSTTRRQGDALLDKQLMTVDDHVGSPFQDRIYVTWTLFAADGTAYIYEAYSRDYGERSAAPKLVSADEPAVHEHARRADAAGHVQREPVLAAVHRPRRRALRRLGQLQRDRPVRPRRGATAAAAGPRGARGARRRGQPPQVLLARSTDGGNIVLRAGEGRRLLRPARLRDLPGRRRGRRLRAGEGRDAQLDLPRDELPVRRRRTRRNPREVDVTFGSYINRHSNEANGCVPQGFNPDTFQPLYDGVKDAGRVQQRHPGQRARPTAAGRSPARPPTSAGCRRRAAAPTTARDQFWQWAAFDPKGRLAVSYYDRSVRQRRADRVLRHQPVRHAQRERLRDDARDDGVDAAAHRSSGATSSATTAG